MTLLSDRTIRMLLAGLACLLVAGTATAQTNPANCTNDIDCVATPQCGGDVCDWSTTPGQMKCKPAGSYPKGMDGWCTMDSDCKCMGLGATCVSLYCTFTRPCDAPDAGPCATGGTGGTGTAGTSGGGGGGGGCSLAGGSSASWSALLLAVGVLGLKRRRRR